METKIGIVTRLSGDTAYIWSCSGTTEYVVKNTSLNLNPGDWICCQYDSLDKISDVKLGKDMLKTKRYKSNESHYFEVTTTLTFPPIDQWNYVAHSLDFGKVACFARLDDLDIEPGKAYNASISRISIKKQDIAADLGTIWVANIKNLVETGNISDRDECLNGTSWNCNKLLTTSFNQNLISKPSDSRQKHFLPTTSVDSIEKISPCDSSNHAHSSTSSIFDKSIRLVENGRQIGVDLLAILSALPTDMPRYKPRKVKDGFTNLLGVVLAYKFNKNTGIGTSMIGTLVGSVKHDKRHSIGLWLYVDLKVIDDDGKKLLYVENFRTVKENPILTHVDSIENREVVKMICYVKKSKRLGYENNILGKITDDNQLIYELEESLTPQEHLVEIVWFRDSSRDALFKIAKYFGTKEELEKSLVQESGYFVQDSSSPSPVPGPYSSISSKDKVVGNIIEYGYISDDEDDVEKYFDTNKTPDKQASSLAQNLSFKIYKNENCIMEMDNSEWVDVREVANAEKPDNDENGKVCNSGFFNDGISDENILRTNELIDLKFDNNVDSMDSASITESVDKFFETSKPETFPFMSSDNNLHTNDAGRKPSENIFEDELAQIFQPDQTSLMTEDKENLMPTIIMEQPEIEPTASTVTHSNNPFDDLGSTIAHLKIQLNKGHVTTFNANWKKKTLQDLADEKLVLDGKPLEKNSTPYSRQDSENATTSSHPYQNLLPRLPRLEIPADIEDITVFDPLKKNMQCLEEDDRESTCAESKYPDFDDGERDFFASSFTSVTDPVLKSISLIMEEPALIDFEEEIFSVE